MKRNIIIGWMTTLAVFVTTASLAGSPAGPECLVAAKDAKSLWITMADAEKVEQLDLASDKIVRSIDMPARPTGLVLSPDGTTLYVTCAAPTGTVVVIDTTSGKLQRSIKVGHWPIGPTISPDGKTLYVCNRFDNNVAFIDLATDKIITVPATRQPYAAAVTPDGKSVYVINHLAADRADGYDIASVVTVIDAATKKTETIRLPNGSNNMRGICASPDGKYIYVTHVLARYQTPTITVERYCFTSTNAFSIIDTKEKKLVNTILIDDVDLGAANPWGITCTADSRTICLAHSGSHEVSLIDVDPVLKKLAALPDTRDAHDYSTNTKADVPNDLAFLVGMRRRVLLCKKYHWASGSTKYTPDDDTIVNGPRGLAIAGSKLYVAAYFTDNLAVVDIKPVQEENRSRFFKPSAAIHVRTIALRPVTPMSRQRRGEMLFSDASLCYQAWFNCSTCHPDARADALNWDLRTDRPEFMFNTRSMLLAHRTPPLMSSGELATIGLTIRKKVTHVQFFIRPEEDADAIEAYLKSLKPIPSPYLVDGRLSDSAERGKKLFFDEEVGCARCHPAPLYTDLKMHNVASRGQYDRRETFDTPALVECWRTAPYMHDGRYLTVKELLFDGKHGQAGETIRPFFYKGKYYSLKELEKIKEERVPGYLRYDPSEETVPSEGGRTEHLTEKQIEDLAEFVKSL